MGIPILRVRDENGNVYAIPAIQGAAGNGIASIALKSGTHAPGTTDTYEITFTDGTTFDFLVYNGANGTCSGDMLASTYDPQGKRTDIFQFVADAIAAIPTPDISGQIQTHNEDAAAHPALRAEIAEKSGKALSFTVTLTVAGWSGNAQTVNNSNFAVSGYAYTVCPAVDSFAGYAEAVIYADDVTAAGKMTFHCSEKPTANLTVNILRTEATA